jgi:TonB family protein
MHPATAITLDSRIQFRATTPLWRAFAFAMGAAASSVIFLGIAHSRRLGLDRPAPPMDDIMSIALPSAPPPPPPPPEQRYEDGGPAPNAIQLDASPSNSPIRVEAVPVVLDTVAAPVIRAVAVIPTDFAPHVLRSDLEFDSSHIWETTQVDQRPVLVWRKELHVPPTLWASIADPRITFIWVVNTDGTVENVHIEHPVEPEFDALVLDVVKSAQFTPALRKGRKVRCWLQQQFIVKGPHSNPFDLY